MSIRERAKGWARKHTDELRSDPQGWAREQGQRLKKMVDVAPFSDAALDRELRSLRERMGRLIGLAAAVLPVVGFITGPLVGSAYGVYRSQKLGDVRRELQEMLRTLAVR